MTVFFLDSEGGSTMAKVGDVIESRYEKRTVLALDAEVTDERSGGLVKVVAHDAETKGHHKVTWHPLSDSTRTPGTRGSLSYVARYGVSGQPLGGLIVFTRDEKRKYVYEDDETTGLAGYPDGNGEKW